MGNKTKYIHYGHVEFDKGIMFVPIENVEYFTKPRGGFWASPVDSQYGWKEWCESNNFCTSRLCKSVTFALSDNAKVFHIRSVDDLENLPRQNLELDVGVDMVYLDFERMADLGYDAVELHLSEELPDSHGFLDGLYWKLYGWDCDSILIMNPDVVEVML